MSTIPDKLIQRTLKGKRGADAARGTITYGTVSAVRHVTPEALTEYNPKDNITISTNIQTALLEPVWVRKVPDDGGLPYFELSAINIKNPGLGLTSATTS